MGHWEDYGISLKLCLCVHLCIHMHLYKMFKSDQSKKSIQQGVIIKLVCKTGAGPAG